MPSGTAPGSRTCRWVGGSAVSTPRTSSREVALTLVETPRGAAFVSARSDSSEASPLWLLDRLTVRRTARSLVAVAGTADPGRFSALADQAVVDVRKVLTSWRGRLVVEVPDDEEELGRVLGSEPGAYGGIAAVTTTADGSLTPDAPVHIFVNPKVFDPLGPRGSQIVMSHEATHVATGAAVSSMPTWLLEGFADYVALDHVDLPVSVTASQILARVRKEGPPIRLPGKTEFDPQNQALGASYESAWLACRLLGERYGERRLIAFYRAADRAGSTVEPFRTLLGTDQRAFTRSWRAYLRSSPGERLSAGAALGAGDGVAGHLEQPGGLAAEGRDRDDDDDGDQGREEGVLDRARARARVRFDGSVESCCRPEWDGGRHDARDDHRSRVDQDGRLLVVLSKTPESLPPRAVIATMMAMAMRATSRPYSTAEAPRSVFAMAVRRILMYSKASNMVASPKVMSGCRPMTSPGTTRVAAGDTQRHRSNGPTALPAESPEAVRTDYYRCIG